MAAIQEGKAAPAFTLEDANGKKVSLKDFAGKNVILYFYPKDDTPGCTKEACGFRDSWKDIQKANAVVLGVSADGGESHQKFISKYKLPFPLLSDAGLEISRAYQTLKPDGSGIARSVCLIDRDGKVRYSQAGAPGASIILESLSTA